MLTDEDIRPDNAPDHPDNDLNQIEPLTVPMEKLWQGFDPEKDYWDRRLLYEVTGERLNEAEFCGDDTSDLDVENVGMRLINQK